MKRSMKDYRGLDAPASFTRLNLQEIYKRCNGCGPKFAGAIVPDRILGMVLTPACDIHDFMYSDEYCQLENQKKSWGGKAHADKTFLNNLERIIRKSKMPWYAFTQRLKNKIARKRQEICIGYYKSVKYLGAISYWG